MCLRHQLMARGARNTLVPIRHVLYRVAIRPVEAGVRTGRVTVEFAYAWHGERGAIPADETLEIARQIAARLDGGGSPGPVTSPTTQSAEEGPPRCSTELLFAVPRGGES